MEVAQDSLAPSLTSGRVLLRTPVPSRPAAVFRTSICNGMSPGWVGYCVPLSAPSEGELLSLHWLPIVLLQAELWKCISPGRELAPLREGRRWGPGLAKPTRTPPPRG